jgi:curli production assembly/transport component CsgF
MNIYNLKSVCKGTLVIMLLSFQAAWASGLVYVPINPSFGGNPNNGPVLLGEAQAQNRFTAPKAAPLTPLQRFNNSLQQAILNQLSTAIKNTIFGTTNGNGATITPGTYDAGNYVVSIVQNADGSLTVSTTDKTNGATATFDVSTVM